MKNEKSRFKLFTHSSGCEILCERHVHEESKEPSILISFFAENEDVEVKLTLSHVYKDDKTRDVDWENVNLQSIADEYFVKGMEMFNEMINPQP